MLKILVPVDGSACATKALEFVITRLAASGAEIHLLNVQDPMDAVQKVTCWTAEQCALLQQQAGETALASARKQLEAAGVPYTAEVASGPVAQTIEDYARDWQCDLIVMGTRGMGAIGNLVLGSVANKVVHLSNLPVTLVK